MIERKDCLVHLKRNYQNILHPLYFSGITKIYNYYKGMISIKDIENFLQTVDTYTTHREPKNPRQTNPTFVYRKRYQFQCDLIEVSAIKRWNNNFTFIMTTIDIFTRKAFCKLLRKKTAVETTKKLKDILQECGQKPDTILFDRGREWHNKHVNGLLDEFGIKKYESDTSIHAPYVERFNWTLQKLIYMHMDKNKSYSFYKELPSIVKLYNNRKHRGLPKLTPNEAEMEENHDKILDWNEKKNTFV